jgi:hypothetical protein
VKKYFGNKTFKWLLIVLFLAALNLAAVKVYFAVVQTQITDKPVLAHTIKDVPLEYWQKLATKKIFFGHQSVGADIIDGIRKIEMGHDFINLHIVEVNETTFGSGPVFLHAAIGHCPDAFSKFSDFEKFMNRLADEKIDIAFMKLCHADIKYEYDTDAIFNAYKKTIAELKARYPQTLFLHITVPLCSKPKGERILRESAKFFALHPSIWDDNQKRQEYNDRIIETFGRTDPIFDLAAAESTDSRGFRHYVEKDGRRIYLLAPEYDIDIGGLSEIGKRKIAEQFLIFLANTAASQN